MYISSVSFKGYKNSKKLSTISFVKGLNILLGENGCGKTAVINALRLALREQESIIAFSADDLYCSLDKKCRADNVEIEVNFSDLDEDEKVIFYSWCDADFNALLHLDITQNKSRLGTFRRRYWGGQMKAGIFEDETLDRVECIYLPPLRDAEVKLSNGKRSRLAYVLKRQFKGDNSLVDKVRDFNNELTQNDGRLKETKKNINERITAAIGREMAQSINLQFSETSSDKIMENIRMVFFPGYGGADASAFRDLATNSLGYNNLLYIATVFSELEMLKETDSFTAVLIEEPEAHLHPQLQIRFIKYIQSVSESLPSAQIIVTTHSPVLASSVDIDKLIHLKNIDDSVRATSLNGKKFGINDDKDRLYLNRWMDATKSTMLFSRGIILVEGIAEAIVVPRLAELVLESYNRSAEASGKAPIGDSLEDMGVSIININGINFKIFMKLFGNFDGSKGDCIPVRCAGITDRDPLKADFSESGKAMPSTNPMCALEREINSQPYTRLFVSSHKTFEYDLAVENPSVMAETLESVWPSAEGKVKEELKAISSRHAKGKDVENLHKDAMFIYEHLTSPSVGKGLFASVLAKGMDKTFVVPDYIRDAVLWVCGAK